MTNFVKGHDVNYFTEAVHGGKASCAGAMGYYTEAAGEPAGQWTGRGAASLGLDGQVEADVIRKLYMEGIGPDGERLVRKSGQKAAEAAAEAAVREFRKGHPYHSATEADDKRTRERAKDMPKSVPYFDLTVSAVKSVSVLHASYRLAAMQARAAGRADHAVQLDARADAIEQAVLDAARDAVRWLERQLTFTRTGYHSSTTGEWRDGAGLTAALFLHHLSRDGDPQLHVHAAIWNRVQRADGADDKWRTLFGRAMFNGKIGLAPVPDRFLEKRLRDLGYVMEQREDRNGCEVGGVAERVMERFSSRGISVAGELERLAAEWERTHGAPPSQRTLWLLHQQAGQNTRRTKAESRRTAGGVVHGADLDPLTRMREWEEQTAQDELTVLSLVHQHAEEYARDAARLRARGGAPGRADAGAGGEDPAVLPLEPVPDAVLSPDEMRRIARIAVVRVQERHAAWSLPQLRWEVHRAAGPGVSADDITAIAELAVAGRAGTPVVQVGEAADVADVTPLGVRASDGGSVYRPPGAELWCTVAHLDLEQHIVEVARRRMVPLVTEGEAAAAVALTDLTVEQAEAVIALLTAGTMTIPLNAAAGSGKTHTMAAFSELWTRFTGGRVIGLTTSTNAARVLANEGLAESYNIAEFLGKVEGSDELRWPVPVNAGDVLIVDEATQCSTADFALLQQAARRAGAFIHPVGDTEQLGAVDAGGIFQLLAESVQGPRLTEIRRFRHQWERDASLRLRAGDVGAVAVYDRRGRIRAGHHEDAFDLAAALYLAEFLRGRNALLLAGSSAEAADLARRVQAQLRRMGRVGEPETDLADGNQAGAGDLIRARLNTEIDAGGQRLTNRDTLRLVRFEGEGDQRAAWAQRRTGWEHGRAAWSAAFRVDAAYLARSAELDYAGNVHVAQGRTVDAGIVAVSQSLSRRGLYVGMTRGREENTAVVVTGNTAPRGKEPYEQATPESVLAGVLEREAPELSATAHMREGQEWAGGAGHVLHLWSVAVRETLYPLIDQMVSDRLPAHQAARYAVDYARQALHARLREAQLAGHDLGELIERICDGGVDGARSVASVLHSRLRGIGLGVSADVSWAQRTPEGAPELARELAEGLDGRQRELGARMAERPEPWLARHLGTAALGPDASPGLREEWERRAGLAAAYREAAGITDPEQPVALMPHEGDPELETYRRATLAALEIRDESEMLAGMSRGELEALVADGDHAVARAPGDVTGDLRLTGRAKADAWAQAARYRVQGDAAAADGSEQLARQLDADAARLEPDAARYEQWSAVTAETREWASKAAAELARRGERPSPPAPGPGGPPPGAEPEPQVPGPGDPGVQDELDLGAEPAAESGSLLSWWQGIQGNLAAAAGPAADAGPSPAEALAGGAAAGAEPAAGPAWWRGLTGGPWPEPGPARVGPEAAEADTPAGPGAASEPGPEPDPEPEPDADPPSPDAADAPRAAGPASPRGAQPVSAASSQAEDEAAAERFLLDWIAQGDPAAEPAAEPERDGARHAAQHDRLDAGRDELWRQWLARQAEADAAGAGPEPDAEAAREAELSARLDDLQVQAEEAAARSAEQEARQDASSDYVAQRRQAELAAELEAEHAGAEYDEPEM